MTKGSVLCAPPRALSLAGLAGAVMLYLAMTRLYRTSPESRADVERFLFWALVTLAGMAVITLGSQDVGRVMVMSLPEIALWATTFEISILYDALISLALVSLLAKIAALRWGLVILAQRSLRFFTRAWRD